MKIVDDIKGLLGEMRTGLAVLAEEDRKLVEENRQLRERIHRLEADGAELIEIIAKQRIEQNTLRAQIDQAALQLGRVHPSSLTDALTVAEDDRSAAIAHVRTLLGILDAVGGYMPTDYQAAIRAAREAVTRG